MNAVDERTNNTPDDLITQKEAAELLGYSSGEKGDNPGGIFRLIDRGIVRSYPYPAAEVQPRGYYAARRLVSRAEILAYRQQQVDRLHGQRESILKRQADDTRKLQDIAERLRTLGAE